MTVDEYKELIDARRYNNNKNDKNCFLSFNSEDNVIISVSIGSSKINVKLLDIKVNENSIAIFTYEPIIKFPGFGDKNIIEYKNIDKKQDFMIAMKEIFPELEI